jgi:predicted RNase H-like HicB family nuclease
MKYRITINQDEDGVFVAACPALPGCWSQGATREAAIANISDAIRGYLQSLEINGDPVPPPITEEIIEIDTRAAG